MSFSKRSCAAAALAVAGVLLSPAASASAQDAGGRFTMTPTPDGLVRLDTLSGTVSLCAKKDGEWACRALPDDQRAMRGRITELEAENLKLKEENKRLEDVMGLNPDAGAGSAPGPGPGGVGKIPVPTEKDVDQAFDYVEGMLRKFRERLKRLDEPDAGGPGGDAPRAPLPPSAPGPGDGPNGDGRRGTSL
ncbi:MAG: hypothetical protein ACK4MF_10085 [Hyphomicrobiaceae bacterium]